MLYDWALNARRAHAQRQELTMAKGQEKKATTNKPKLTVKEKKEKKKLKKAK
jgi:hypothetical protein